MIVCDHANKACCSFHVVMTTLANANFAAAKGGVVVSADVHDDTSFRSRPCVPT